MGADACDHGKPAGASTLSFHSALTGVQEAYVCLVGAHQREIDAFTREAEVQKREVQQLREKVAQLSQTAKAAETAALCARIDEPDMQDVAEQVAVNMASEETTAATAVGSAAAAAPPPSAQDTKGRSGPPKAEEQQQQQLQLVKGGSSANVDGHLHFGRSNTHDTIEGRRVSRECAKAILDEHAPKGKRPSAWVKVFGTANPVEMLMDPKDRRAEEIRKELEKYQSPAEKRLRRAQGFGAQHSHGSKTSLGRRKFSWKSLVDHPGFDSLCAVIIILNSFLVGYDVQWRTVHPTSQLWIELASYFCNLFFVVELIVRMVAVGWRDFFCGDSQLWSIFDTLLVVISIADLLMSLSGNENASNNVSSGVKTVKMLRIARVFRVFRFFKELSLLALMILDSMKSLMWALLMLSIILYVFAILFTQSASDYIRTDPRATGVPELQRQFGDIPKTLYSLLQAMLGGVSWGVASDSLFHIHWSTCGLFFFYIFFTILAFLNVTTGVFVDNAVETARTQRDFLVQKETEIKEKYLAEMRALFTDMDEDGSGTVSLEEVSTYFEDPRVQSYFAALGLDSADAERLFSLLDTDLDGDVSIDEFLEGCLRLKGFARSIDVHHLLMEFKKFNKMVTKHM